MGNLRTIPFFKKLIIMENIFCINRSYLIDSHFWLICNVIFVTVSSIFSCVIIYDFFSDDHISTGLRTLQIISLVEIFCMAKAARSAKAFPTITKLDEKCDEEEDYVTNLKDEISNAETIFVVSTLLDLVGFLIVDMKPSLLLTFFIESGAHDAEIVFYSLLINVVNLRLSKLEMLPERAGAKIYGYILIASATLSEDFSIRIIFSLALTFFRTVLLMALFILSDNQITKLSVYMCCRHLKTMYSVWILCGAATQSENICKHLSFQLTNRLIFDPQACHYRKKTHYNTVNRWLAKVTCRRPTYISGSFLSINMSILINLLDLGISYMLIVVQIYMAFFYVEAK